MLEFSPGTMVTEHAHFAQYVESVEVTYNRPMSNSQDIPLKRIAVEAAVIVTSILLACAIQAMSEVFDAIDESLSKLQ